MRRGLYNQLSLVQDVPAQQTFRLMQERLTHLDNRLRVDADDIIGIASDMDRTNKVLKDCVRLQLQQTNAVEGGFFNEEPDNPDSTGTPGEPSGGGGTFIFDPVTYGGCSSDELSTGYVTWLHKNPSTWAQTSEITSIKISPNEICVRHTKSGKWPTSFIGSPGDLTETEGNPWIIANIGGTWYGGTWEWLRVGQECKGLNAADLGPHIKKSPMRTWLPAPGELVYFMMSTRARSEGGQHGRERTSICGVNWPLYTRG